MKAIKTEKLRRGRQEEWRITFDRSITAEDIEKVKDLCLGVSWLWDPQVFIESDNTVFYKGYTD